MPSLVQRAGRASVAPLALAVMVLVFFAPVLLTGRIFYEGDLCFLFYPGYVFFRETAAQGALPLWNPYLGCGEPFLAHLQRGVFYPPNLMHLLMSTSTAVVVLTCLHVLLAGTGTFALLRVWRVSPMGSLLGGVLYAFSSYTMTKLAFPSQLDSAAWLPVVLTVFACWLRRPSRLWLVLTAVALCLQFLAGYPEVVAFTVACMGLCALFAGFHQWRARGKPTSLVVPFLGLAGAGVLALPLSMAQLLPTWEAIGLSGRAKTQDPQLDQGSVHPMAVFSLLVPSVYGRGGGELTYWAPAIVHYTQGTFYVGVLPMVVFVAVAIGRLSGGRVPRDRAPPRGNVARIRTPFFITVLVLAFLYSMGRYSPFFDICWRVVPILQHFVWPSKCLVCVALSLSCLAGIGLDALALDPLDRPEGRRPWRARLLRWGPFAVFAAMTAFVVACLLNGGQLGEVVLRRWFNLDSVPACYSQHVPWDALLADCVKLPIVALTSALLLQAYTFRARSRSVVAWLMVVVAFADLSVSNIPLLELGSPAALDGQSAYLDKLCPPGKTIRFLGTRNLTLNQTRDVSALVPKGATVEQLSSPRMGGPDADVGEGIFRLQRDMLCILWPVADRAFCVLSKSVFAPADVSRVSQLIYGGPPNAKRARLLSMLNCDRLLLPTEESGTPTGRVPDPPRLAILDKPMPRAYVVGGVEILEDKNEVLAALGYHPFDPWQTALIDRASARDDALTDLRPARVGHEVRRLEYVPNGLEIDVASDSTGMLVVSDTYYPGWSATVNGQSTPIYKVNGAFRGIRIPAGDCAVRMTYRPWSVLIGAAISLTTLLVVLVLLVPRPGAGAFRRSDGD